MQLPLEPPTLLRLVVTGSRSITDPRQVAAALEHGLDAFQDVLGTTLPPLLVIHGGAPGVDRLATAWATARAVPVEVREPDYARYGNAATHVRNREMVKGADAVIACWDGTSTGTLETIGLARVHQRLLYVYTPEEEPHAASHQSHAPGRGGPGAPADPADGGPGPPSAHVAGHQPERHGPAR